VHQQRHKKEPATSQPNQFKSINDLCRQRSEHKRNLVLK